MRADQQPVFWSPNIFAATVILTPADDALFPSARPLLLDDWQGGATFRDGPDGTHVLLRDGPHEHHLWITNHSFQGRPLTALLPFDPNIDARRSVDQPRFGRMEAVANERNDWVELPLHPACCPEEAPVTSIAISRVQNVRQNRGK
jgi:hypothetical protein